MRLVRIVALSLSALLLPGVADLPAASGQSTVAAAESKFVPADAWRLKGYGRFDATSQPPSSFPTCEARKGLPANTPVRYHVARKVKAPLAVHAAQYIVELPNAGDAEFLVRTLADSVRRKCASSQRRQAGNTQFAHRYHMQAPVPLANGGGAEPTQGTLAIWSTSYREQLVQAFDTGDGAARPAKDSTAFGGLTVVAVGSTGRYVTALTFALEETMAPPWKALRKTARIAMKMLSPDPWAA